MNKEKYIIEEYYHLDNSIEIFIKENGTVFHQYNFLTAVGKNYICYVAKECSSDKIIAVLPLVKTVKFGLKSYHIPPFAYQFGPVYNLNLKIEFDELFILFYNKINRNSQLDFKIFIPNQNIGYFKKLKFYIEANQTFIIKIDSNYNISEIHNSKKRYLKKLISLLEKGDIKIVTGKDCLLDLIEVYKKNSHEVGFKSNLEYLRNLTKNLKSTQYFCHVIYSKNGRALAGSFCPYDKRTAYYLINASIKNIDKLLDKINILSTHLAIEKARDLNLNFDFEGSNIYGVAKYYQMMGGKPKINFRLQKTKSLFYNMLKGLYKIKQSLI